MVVYCSSDGHCSPQGLSEPVKQFIHKAKVNADLIVGNGDLFNLMEYPWKEFVNCRAVQEFEKELDGRRFTVSRPCFLVLPYEYYGTRSCPNFPREKIGSGKRGMRSAV